MRSELLFIHPISLGMSEEDVMTGLVSLDARCIAVARGASSSAVSHPRDDPGFVECDPEIRSVPECLEADSGVFHEPILALGIQPASPVLEGLGQVPVIQGHLLHAHPKMVIRAHYGKFSFNNVSL